jgi:hypothetical protein
MELNKKYQSSFFVVIYRKTKEGLRYLILKRKLDWKGWEFPKGLQNKDISIVKTIKQEIQKNTKQIPSYIKKYHESGKYEYNKIIQKASEFKGGKYNLYSAELKSNKIKLNNTKHSSYKWADYKQAIEYLSWENQRKCLRIVNDKLEDIFFLKPKKVSFFKPEKKPGTIKKPRIKKGSRFRTKPKPKFKLKKYNSKKKSVRKSRK